MMATILAVFVSIFWQFLRRGALQPAGTIDAKAEFTPVAHHDKRKPREKRRGYNTVNQASTVIELRKRDQWLKQAEMDILNGDSD